MPRKYLNSYDLQQLSSPQITHGINLSTNWWFEKETQYTHVCKYTYMMEYYSAMKTNENLSFATKWVESEIIMPSEVNSIQEDKNHIFSYLLKWIHEMVKMSHFLIHSHNFVALNYTLYMTIASFFLQQLSWTPHFVI